MIRTTLLAIFCLSLALIAFRNWFFSLCGLIVLMAVISHETFPGAILGIQGLNPWNLLLMVVLLARLAQQEPPKHNGAKAEDIPSIPGLLKFLLWSFFLLVVFGVVRYSLKLDETMAYNLVLGRSGLDAKGAVWEFVINPVKWVVPGILVYFGCNSPQRARWLVISIAVLYFLLAILVIRWMPLDSIADATYMEKRAARVLDREIGYYRTDLSMMLAGASWAFICILPLFENKYKILLYGGAFICLLGMALTGGRTGYVSWAVIGTVVAFFKYRKYLALAPLLMVAVLWFVPSAMDRMLQGFGSEDNSVEQDGVDLYEITAGRIIAWPLAIDEINRKPLFGHGVLGWHSSGTSTLLYEITESTRGTGHPHNGYLEILLDHGYLGGGLIIFLFLLIAKMSLDLFREKSDRLCQVSGGLCLTVVMALLLAAVGGQGFYPVESAVPIWCSIGLMLRVYAERARMKSGARSALLENLESGGENHSLGISKPKGTRRRFKTRVHG